MMNYVKTGLTLAGATAFALALAGCTGGATNTALPAISPPTASGQYVQIERLSRPAVKELFEKFVDHQTSNAAQPYNDPTLKASIIGLTDALRPPGTFGNKPADYGVALASILYPDEYTVDLSQPGNASYLGAETGGATGGKFGGRDINDDVIGISLGAVFGGTLPALGVQPEDNQENNCLSKENVAQNPRQAKSGTFPYLATAR